MQIPERLLSRLENLGLDESVYSCRTRKCILSRDGLGLEKVPWYSNAYFIDENFENKKDFFVFDPVSLVPCLALGPEKQDRILDMCAAPGTKTYILSFLTENEARIVANDISHFRARRLKANVNKFNISAEVTSLSGRRIAGRFDKILLDAPCSGEGMVNKKEKLFEHWSEKKVRLLAKTQKKLAGHAFSLLEPGGLLVYSTCTFEPAENEEVIDFLLKKYPSKAEIAAIEIKNLVHGHGLAEWNGKAFDKSMENCMRIYPQHNGTTGFFTVRIRRL